MSMDSILMGASHGVNDKYAAYLGEIANEVDTLISSPQIKKRFVEYTDQFVKMYYTAKAAAPKDIPPHPIHWFPIYDDGMPVKPIEKSTEKELLMCHYVRLTTIHDLMLTTQQDTPIYFKPNYEGDQNPLEVAGYLWDRIARIGDRESIGTVKGLISESMAAIKVDVAPLLKPDTQPTSQTGVPQRANEIIAALTRWLSIDALENWTNRGLGFENNLKQTFREKFPKHGPDHYLDFRLSILNELGVDPISLKLLAEEKDGLAAEIEQRQNKFIKEVRDYNSCLEPTSLLHLPTLQLHSSAASFGTALKEALPYLGTLPASGTPAQDIPEEQNGEKAGDEIKPTETEQEPPTKTQEWSELSLDVIDDDTIRYKIGQDNWQRATYAELGFKDKRKCLPNKLWGIFRTLAEHCQGQVIECSTQKNISKDIDRICETLKVFFGPQDRPIRYNKKNKIWKVAFTLTFKSQDSKDS